MHYLVAFLIMFTLLAASNSAEASQNEIRICVGGKGGGYYSLVMAMNNNTIENVFIPIESAGSRETAVSKLFNGDCDAGIVQGDTMPWLSHNYPEKYSQLQIVAAAIKEEAHLICKKDARIGELNDLFNQTKYTLGIGKPGSGTRNVFEEWAVLDPRISSIPVLPAGGILAINQLTGDPSLTCVLTIMAAGSPDLRNIDKLYNGVLELVDIDNRHLNDALDASGKPIYKYIAMRDVYQYVGGLKGNVKALQLQAIVISPKNKLTDEQLSEIGLAIRGSLVGKQ